MISHNLDSKLNTNFTEINNFTGLLPEINNIDLLPSDLIMVPVRVGVVNTEALVDSGASISLISSDIAVKLPHNIETQEQFVSGLGGRRVKCTGSISVSMALHGISLKDITLLVVPSGVINHSVVLGTDWLKDNALILDPMRNRISGKFIRGGQLGFIFV